MLPTKTNRLILEYHSAIRTPSFFLPAVIHTMQRKCVCVRTHKRVRARVHLCVEVVCEGLSVIFIVYIVYSVYIVDDENFPLFFRKGSFFYKGLFSSTVVLIKDSGVILLLAPFPLFCPNLQGNWSSIVFCHQIRSTLSD